MITASVGVDSSLLLEPSRELLFPLPHSTSMQRPHCSLTLTNLSSVHDVVFRIRTRNPDAFTVRPTHGVVTPGASLQVAMTATARFCERLGAMNARDLVACESSELFLVQSLELGKTVQHLELLDRSSTASLRAVWNQVPKECITENKMVCRFMETSPEATQPKNLFSRSMFSVRPSSHKHSGIRNEQSLYSTSARSSHSGSSRLNRSFSNLFTPPEATRSERRHRQESVDSDDSYYTTLEFPMPMDPRMSASTSNARSTDPSVNSRRSEANTSSSVSKPSISRQRDIAPSSHNGNGGSVSDTMLTALSTETIPYEHTQEVGPLLYQIQPSDVLSFTVQPAPRYWGSTSLFIVNASQNDCLIFKVRTSNQLGYVVKPSRGAVSITSAQKVIVSICAPRDDAIFDPAKREAKDGFMIEVANITRELYSELMTMDDQKRSSQMKSLWSRVPQNNRQSTMLSVELKVQQSDGNSGANTMSEGRKHGIPTRSNEESKNEEARRKSLHSADNLMKKLSISSSTDESHDGEERITRDFVPSNLDKLASAIAPRADVENNDDKESVAEIPARRGSAVVVVSADRMDNVDFSNPKLSFFI